MLRKNQRSPKISRFVMIWLLQLRLIFCCSCILPVCFSWGLFWLIFFLLLRLSCLLQLRLIFCCSCILHCTYSRQRERERERERESIEERDEKQKAKSEVGTIVVCCTKTCGCNFKMCGWWESSICRINNVWREKNIKWAMILLLMVHLLFVIWKVKK